MSDYPGRHVNDTTGPDEQPEQVPGVTTYREQAHPGTETQEAGRVRVSKRVETYPVEEVVPRHVEHADTSERMPAAEGDSGEVEMLEDGSVSIPIFEEVLVVTKKLVVRERVIVRKRTVIDEHRLQTELRRERVEVETEGTSTSRAPTGRPSHPRRLHLLTVQAVRRERVAA